MRAVDLTFMLFVCTAFAAQAEAPAAPARDDASTTAPPASEAAGPITVKGRVELRGTTADDEEWSRNYEARAILGADFAYGERFAGQAEIGVSALPELRDAWVRMKATPVVSFQAGRFRPPFGRFEQTSRWDLPIVRRGAISSHAEDLGFADRRNGLEMRLRNKALRLRPQFSLGVFQGDRLADGSRAEDVVGRGVVRLAKGVTAGLGAYARGAFREGVSERFLLAADAGVARGPFELAGEVQAGPQLQGALVTGSWRFVVDVARGTWLQPAVTAELVKVDGASSYAPFVVPALAAGTGPVRAVFALELGSGRQSPGSTRTVGFSAIVGAGF